MCCLDEKKVFVKDYLDLLDIINQQEKIIAKQNDVNYMPPAGGYFVTGGGEIGTGSRTTGW